MSAFHQVPSSMYDLTFSRLPRSAQTLELYIRSCPHRSTEGLFRLRLGAVEDDLGMDRAEATAALEVLKEHGRPFQFDIDAGVVLDLSALPTTKVGARKKKDPETWTLDDRDRRVKGAIGRLRALPPTPLLKQLLVVADASGCVDLAEAMREEFADLPDPDTDEYLSAVLDAPFDAPSPAPLRAPSNGARRAESSSEERRRVVAL